MKKKKTIIAMICILVKGDFMPEDEFSGVTKWTYYLFGIELQTQIRD